ncbi:G patch domain-containing protein 11 [Geranomyces variabilis]|uniref:G patch domain-containing protein 11 n=1 Tax=Geranomyces variabilis TaxID=109894 RepID=A0AAD5TM78_9FUNG|nr:G patch domain-containing protein 11 [Geranomyces variabilis]
MTAGGSDSEEDYMSEALLQTLAPQPETVKYSERRRQTVQEQAKKGYTKPIWEQERERREEGLAAEIGAENKGFQMLAKMGFKKEEGLGNPDLPDDARLRAPIEVVLRERKRGLGHSPPLAPSSKRARTPSPDTAVPEQLTTDFRLQKRQRLTEAKTLKTLRKARRICETLDEATGIQRHMLWLPDEKPGKDVEDEGGESGHGETTLERLIERENHEEIDQEQPDATEDLWQEVDQFAELEPPVQLAAVTSYLRELHRYCIWCGAAYQTSEELRDICPGETEEDHEGGLDD